MAATLRSLLRFLVILSLSSLCWGESNSGDKDTKKDDTKATSPDQIGPAKYGSSDYWVYVKGMGFSEGHLKPDFKENITNYNLMIHNGKAKQLLVTIQLDTEKYNLLEMPVLIWNGKKMHYSPIETIEFTMPLNNTIDELNEDATLVCKDKKEGSLLYHTNSRTYTIRVRQIPDIEQIVTARSITVKDANSQKVIQASPPYTPETKENEIVYFVDAEVEKVVVTVECPKEASLLKYNGIQAAALDAPYSSHEIEGASKSILAQCIYKHFHWTSDKEMQRTYVIKIARNHKLAKINVSLRVWPPSQGLCKTSQNTIGSDGAKIGKDGYSVGYRFNFSCMGYAKSLVPLLGTYTEPKAELVIVNTETNATYRLWNGIPSRIPLGGPYRLHLKAGMHERIYPFSLSHPPTCPHVDCSEGTAFKNQGYPDLFRWWSNGSATRYKYCKWEPCNIQDDFKQCCAHKGATCDTYDLCKDPTYRAEKPEVCPDANTYKKDNGEMLSIYNDHSSQKQWKHVLNYDYSSKKQWTCSHGNDTVTRLQRCAWTPCVDTDNDNQQCCGAEGSSSCSTMDCPLDMVQKATSKNAVCASSPCSSTDIQKCCGFRDICTSMTCPNGYSLKYNAALFMCAGEGCSATDRDQCCDSAAYCDSWTCPPLWSPKKNVGIIPCGGFPCMEWDTGLCCNMQGMCSTLNCPVGYYKRDHAETRPCAGIANRTCNLDLDLHRCCQPAAVCTESYVCDKGSGYLLKLNAKYLSCPSYKCTDADRNLCCDMVDPFKAAKAIVVVPGDGEGSCTKKSGDDGDYFFECTGSKSITSMHLVAKFTFEQAVGNQIYFGTTLLSGRSASMNLKEIPIPSSGKKYSLQMHCRVAGRGQATGKVSIFVNGMLDSGEDSGEDSDADSGQASTTEVSRKITEVATTTVPDTTTAEESVLRKLVGRQLSALVSSSSRTSTAVVIVAAILAFCAV